MPRPLFGILSLLLVATVPGCAPDPDRPPNVILISIDTLRQDHVGCYGYERDTTPNIDAFATEAVLFERAYTTMSWTLIAHMSMLTGLYPSQHGVMEANLALPRSIPTLAQRLSDQGFQTFGFYDRTAHWVDPEFGYDRGFDLYRPHSNVAQAGNHLRKALDERRKKLPFFAFVHLFDVHSAPIDKSERPIYDPPAPHDSHFISDAKARLQGVDSYRWWNEDAKDASPEQHEALVALYDGGIRFVDERIGEWLDQWRASGLLDDSIVIITSDHGEGLCDHDPKYGGHGGTREEGLLVPLLIRYPSAENGGTRVPGSVSLVDLVPTVLDRLGFEADARLPGFSLLESRPPEVPVFAERTRVRVALRWPLKFTEWSDGSARLFDLEEDPDEKRPILPRRKTRERFKELAPLMRELSANERADWFSPEGENPTLGEMSRELRERMDQLGYGGEE